VCQDRQLPGPLFFTRYGIDLANGMQSNKKRNIFMANALVMDDSRAMRGVLSKILVQLGFETLQAANGIEALAVMAREGDTIEVILADWNMPEMNGLEFVKALRAQPRFDAVRILMVTTETEVDQMILALTAGANEYVMKPFTPSMVEEKLRMLQVIE
jgi:two-component system chemotaxis response regulator CheY